MSDIINWIYSGDGAWMSPVLARRCQSRTWDSRQFCSLLPPLALCYPGSDPWSIITAIFSLEKLCPPDVGLGPGEGGAEAPGGIPYPQQLHTGHKAVVGCVPAPRHQQHCVTCREKFHAEDKWGVLYQSQFYKRRTRASFCSAAWGADPLSSRSGHISIS